MGDDIDGDLSQRKSSGVMEEENKDENEVPVLFFNYHEFVATDPNTVGPQLVINHFPNNHSGLDSSTYRDTRIVRIPRIYSTIDMSDIIPQFSIFPLGEEPNAIIENSASGTLKTYKIEGEYDVNFFGQTSLTPLVPDLITSDELILIVTRINRELYEAFDPYSVWNALDNILELITGTFYSKIVNTFIFETHCKRKLAQLELYIEELNKKYSNIEGKGFKIISLRRSAYLSLDIEIPRPLNIDPR
ncbi:ras modification protein Erf4p [[Candida] railenensis]|uniref:Ras modification protein ERF4 n=1 Tax=[Candida] railenensis TaxID=45579 RepID=A0A9P0QMI8_9ASCO|nr:ras modification protein Erf4p [[Candida] railenensis]